MSKYVDAMTERFEEITIFDEPALFTCLRIDPETIPVGVYKYEIRHDDECQGIACELARRIIVNHWGSVLTLRPFDLGEEGRIYMDGDEINYGVDSCVTLPEFMKRYSKDAPLPSHEEER
ncbi:MAG: hypothetical protein J5854_02560 [Clostridia bacterium]|nr:hypothetical protein [Clostridia bacterium]